LKRQEEQAVNAAAIGKNEWSANIAAALRYRHMRWCISIVVLTIIKNRMTFVKFLQACGLLVDHCQHCVDPMYAFWDTSGFNIGMNVGASAGQTVFHAHIHLIPRRDGDTPDPRGGVRGVIEGRRGY
jgi:hypothetical protein